MSRIAVIGFGSIGRRHADNFASLGAEVAVVTGIENATFRRFVSVAEMLAAFDPHVVLVCNKTSDHLKTMEALIAAGYSGQIIVEKPVVHDSRNLNSENEKIFSCVRVSYNLRFHRVLQNLASEISPQKIVSVHAYVGQYLPTWRPNVDYRSSYSAKSSEGGGVLLDLSHEFDFLRWMLGPIRSLVADGGHLSPLEIDSEDTFSLILKTERCSHVSVTLNYTDRITQRFVIVNTTEHSYKADLVARTLSKDGERRSFTEFDGNHSYLAMSEDILENEARGLTGFAEALQIVRVVEAAKQSNELHKWVNL